LTSGIRGQRKATRGRKPRGWRWGLGGMVWGLGADDVYVFIYSSDWIAVVVSGLRRLRCTASVGRTSSIASLWSIPFYFLIYPPPRVPIHTSIRPSLPGSALGMNRPCCASVHSSLRCHNARLYFATSGLLARSVRTT